MRNRHSRVKNECCRDVLFGWRLDSSSRPAACSCHRRMQEGRSARVGLGIMRAVGGSMRTIKAVWLAGGVLLGALVPVTAQEACTPGPDALGVSRVAEIDTRAGPRFVFQYKEQDILADGEVVLTFDDGPLRVYTKPVLEALAAHCTKATFFLVGRMAVADPEMVREYARLGHTVGIHTW